MSFYVKRTQQGDGPNRPDGSIGWTGPIRSARQAERERAAWMSSVGSYGQHWTAEVLTSTASVRADVRAWQRAGRVRIRIAR